MSEGGLMRWLCSCQGIYYKYSTAMIESKSDANVAQYRPYITDRLYISPSKCPKPPRPSYIVIGSATRSEIRLCKLG